MLHYSSDEETKKRVRHGLMTHPLLYFQIIFLKLFLFLQFQLRNLDFLTWLQQGITIQSFYVTFHSWT